MSRPLRVAALLMIGVLAGVAAAHARQSTGPVSAARPATHAATDPDADADAGAGGSRVAAGVPAGFSHTRRGAVAAASAYVATGAAVMSMPDTEVRAAVAQMAAAGSGDAQAADLLDRLRRLRRTIDGAAVSYRQATLAVRVDAYDDTRARVAIWHVGVLAAGTKVPPQAGWSISTFELVWERGDWKVWAETSTPGPAPMPDDSAPPATTGSYDTELGGFTATADA